MCDSCWNGKKVINGNCWVAYFDILGFKNLMKDFYNQFGEGHLDVFVKNHYEDVLEELKKRTKYWPEKVFISWFSDSFILYTIDDSNESFSYISPEATQFFAAAIEFEKTPLRGALAVGEFFVNKNRHIYVGPAFIKACEYAEKQNWIGFVLTPKVGDRLKRGTSSGLINDYKEYDVPIKKRKQVNETIQIEAKTEKLFAYNLNKSPYRLDRKIKQMQQEAKSKYPDEYEARYKTIYENTLKFMGSTKAH